MEIGPATVIGPNVQQHVATVRELTIELATILNQNMVEFFAQIRKQKQNHALFPIVQVCEQFFFFKVGPNQSSFNLLISIIFTVNTC